ncbi:MAG: hypothetical protein ACUVWS_03975 [Roseiflexus sp.]
MALGALALLTGCSDFVDHDQTSIAPEIVLTLKSGYTVGQSFVAQHGGLSGIEVYLLPDSDAQGDIILHLRDSVLSTTDILTVSLSINNNQEGYYHFAFPPLLHSHTRYLYAFLEYNGTSQIGIPTGNFESYRYGALFFDHEPQKAQAIFRLRYDPVYIVRDLLLTGGEWVKYGFASLFILFLSGYSITRRWVHQGMDFTFTLSVSILIALALWMTFLVWFGMFIRLEEWSARVLAGLSSSLGALFLWKDRQIWWRKSFWIGHSSVYTIAFWVIVLLSIALWLFVGRRYIMLPGADAYHHTLITQLFVEQGGIPSNYHPYAPLDSFSYHFGFHSISLFFCWLFGADLLDVTKNTALVLNGSIACIAGLLSERVTGSRRSAVISAALAGLILVSPFCLLRWSRFTQTTGMLFLAASIWVLLVEKDQKGWFIPVLLIPGMIFSHYRVALFGAIFMVIMGAVKIFRGDWKYTRNLVLIGLLSLIVSAPWVLRIAWIQYDPYKLRITYPVLGHYNALDRFEGIVLSFATNQFVAYAFILLSGMILLLRRTYKELESVFVIWGIVMVGGGALFPGITGGQFWELITALLTLSIPVATLIGVWAHEVLDAMPGKLRLVFKGALITLLTAGIASGIYYLPNVVYTDQPYIRPGDMVTMEWIKNNIPENALFMVESLPIDWSPGWMVGVDSGYWIPLLAGRASTLPPMIYPVEWVNRSRLSGGIEVMYKMRSEQGTGSVPASQILSEYGVTHVMVNYEHNLIQSAWLSDPGLEEVYRYDRGKILAVRNSVSNSGKNDN